MVPMQKAIFWGPAFPANRVQHVSDLHLTFAPRCKINMVNALPLEVVNLFYTVIRTKVTLHCESKKGCHPIHGYNFVNS